jgi:hypothetical protein
VFFEIQVRRPKLEQGEFFAKVVDGHLIQNLPIAVVDSLSTISDDERYSCRQAYEADVVNLLVGPLAEAKYVSLCDDEIFNLNLMNLKALNHYGGHSDLERAQYYLDYFISSKSHREKKLGELLVEAFRFIDNPWHWQCVSRLADYILQSRQETISCDEAIAIFDASLTSSTARHWKNQVSLAGR